MLFWRVTREVVLPCRATLQGLPPRSIAQLVMESTRSIKEQMGNSSLTWKLKENTPKPGAVLMPKA